MWRGGFPLSPAHTTLHPSSSQNSEGGRGPQGVSVFGGMVFWVMERNGGRLAGVIELCVLASDRNDDGDEPLRGHV